LARKILLADDSVTAQNMGRRILSDAGYEVTTVNNGSAALKRIAESKPDLIVLDVYMPGYGGLEVCQRLRESKETARIPVLLTVGKLEPFKPEEARRVRADAFIVKPFEASELLTALTKLEDRIVPQPAPYKPGRFAKAISALEADAQSNEYGDLESGWKNRLKIPVPQSHGQELEMEEQAEEQAKPAESRKPETPAQKPAEELAVVPRDITPEEIAAINAAAAAFGTQIVESTAEPEAVAASEPIVQAEESQPETVADSGDEVAATFATAATVEETQAEPERVETEQRSEPPVAEEVKAEVTETATNAAPETQAEMPATPTEDVAMAAPVEMQPVVEERDDFAAALASLTPANGNGVPAVQQFSGPRWTAELVAVTDAESALILDQEMEKAVAAMAARAAETVQASDTAEASASNSVEEKQQEADRTPAEEIASRTVEDEAATSLVAAMMNQAAMPTLSDLVDSVLPRASDEAVTPESQGAAFAAAAAAGGDAVSPSVAPSEVPPSDAPPVAPSAGEAVERQRESELAAAWESWKHIRESVVEPQFKSPAADAAAETHAPEAEQVSSAQPESDDETSVQEEAGAIASIVDSVLADLKPRLMEEISKKMGKEKKRR
jgi:CheY-like chemotaxis protein